VLATHCHGKVHAVTAAHCGCAPVLAEKPLTQDPEPDARRRVLRKGSSGRLTPRSAWVRWRRFRSREPGICLWGAQTCMFLTRGCGVRVFSMHVWWPLRLR